MRLSVFTGELRSLVGMVSDDGRAHGDGSVIDALTHNGAADPARISPASCLSSTLPGLDLVGLANLVSTVAHFAAGVADPATWTGTEPPLTAYARSYGGY